MLRSINTVRSAILFIAAVYLIFSQDHSVAVGMAVLLFVTSALAFAGAALYKTSKGELTARQYLIPSGLALLVAILILAFQAQQDNAVFAFRSLVFLFAIGMAAIELQQSLNAEPEDVLELRISSALGLITGLVFWLAPLDELNAVGFLSAYLALSAVQRGVWAATPTNGKKTNNG